MRVVAPNACDMSDPAAFPRLLEILRAPETPRVWSLLVTIFGDLAQEKDATLSGTALGRLTAPMGIKPEALRVALHRLRRDGWIESTKTGRTSHYSLTGAGRRESAEASPLIYGPEPRESEAALVIAEEDIGTADWVRVTPQVALAPGRVSVPGAFVTEITRDTSLPDWIRAKVCDEDLCAACSGLAARLGAFQVDMQTAVPLSPIERAILRVAIVHGWRRVILKAPLLPDHVFPEAWEGARCRERVAQCLASLPRPALAEIEST